MVIDDRKHHPSHNARCRGMTILELTCAFAVLGTLTTVAFPGFNGGMQRTRNTWQQTLALEAASARLEQLQSITTSLQLGRHRFRLDESVAQQLPGAKAEQNITEEQPGLYRVVVSVRWRPGVPPMQLQTLVVRELPTVAPKEGT